jgi:hypothetical protein
MTLNSTGLGVGTVPSSYKFEVGNGGSDTRAIFNPNNAFSIGVKNGANQLGGWIGSAGNNILTFSGNDGTMKVTIDNPGNVGVGVTPSASGGCLQLKSGITFPATQVASSDANTLDDYEEGMWTGTIKGSTTDPTTPVTATGRYTKIGRSVTVDITFSGVTTTGAVGDITVTGLPFANGSVPAVGSAGIGAILAYSGTLTSVVDPSGTTIFLVSQISSSYASLATHVAGASKNLLISITYSV